MQLGSFFTAAANLVELGTFLRWMMRRPDLAHRLLRLTADLFIRLAERWAGPLPGLHHHRLRRRTQPKRTRSSRRAHFREFALPYAQEVHEKALAAGITRFHTHACGEQNGNLAAYRELDFGRPGGPPGMISFGHEARLTDAIEAVGDRVIVAGNVEPTLLQVAPAETVWEATRAAVLAGRDAPLGYVLMTGCSRAHRRSAQQPVHHAQGGEESSDSTRRPAAGTPAALLSAVEAERRRNGRDRFRRRAPGRRQIRFAEDQRGDPFGRAVDLVGEGIQAPKKPGRRASGRAPAMTCSPTTSITPPATRTCW